MTHGEGQRRNTLRRRAGFTTIELLIVVLVGSLLAGIAVPRFKGYIDRRNAMNARSALVMSAARARAAAVERGEVVVMMIRIYRDSIFVMAGEQVGSASWTDTLEVTGFHDGDIRGDLLIDGTPAPLKICYLPQGYAHPSCEHGSYLPVDVDIVSANGGDTVSARITPVGHVEPL
ncbi:MAG: type IV pilin protein [Gemmatimonadota bacterium]